MDGTMKELIQLSLDQMRYMESLLTDLLFYSRPDQLTPEWLSLEQLIESSLKTFDKLIAQHQVEITTECQKGLPALNADADKLLRVLANLISNAIQAHEGREEKAGEVTIPKVTIRCSTQELPPELFSKGALKGSSKTGIQIDIIDNGPGIDAAIKDKLFEPFYTLRAKGTGLGLPIVQRIVQQHGGTVSLEPAPLGGTCARVLLPIGAMLPRKDSDRTPGDNIVGITSQEIKKQNPKKTATR